MPIPAAVFARILAALVVLAAWLLAAWAAPARAQVGPVGEPQGEWREQVHLVPLPHDGGRAMHVLVLRPPGEDRRPLVVINHGSPTNPAQRPAMRPGFRAAAEWFLKRGQIVALPLRRGYGATGGDWAEAYGRCEAPDYVRAGLESAKDIAAALDYLAAQPFVAPEPAVVVGQSAGGWAALALASRNPPTVAAVVNFAGGRGGYKDNRPSSNCAPDRLVDGAREFGRTARIPTLWIYTQNDLFFGPSLSARMADAFRSAGGVAEYLLLPPFGKDGHTLFGAADGVERWAPFVERFLGAKRR
jgi:dienelactone hydrolase